jgi:hypothetical protein
LLWIPPEHRLFGWQHVRFGLIAIATEKRVSVHLRSKPLPPQPAAFEYIIVLELLFEPAVMVAEAGQWQDAEFQSEQSYRHFSAMKDGRRWP